MKSKLNSEVECLTSWKAMNWRAEVVLLLLLLALILHGQGLLSRVWSNTGLVVLTQALVTEPEEEVSFLKARLAETLLSQAIVYQPGNRTAWQGLGFALVAQGRQDEAVVTWQTVGKTSDEFIRSGEQERNARHYKKALMWYKWAVMLEPNSAIPWYYVGLAHEGLGQWDEALEAFQQAGKRTDSKDIEGSIFFHQGLIFQQYIEPPDSSTAPNLYQAAVTSDRFLHNWERVSTHYRWGDILRRQGKFQAALEEFRWVVSVQPQHYWGHMWFGKITWQINGDLDVAEKHLKQAIVLEPETKWAYQWLGDIYLQAGNSIRADEMYHRVLEIDPCDQIVLDSLRKTE